MSKYVKDLVTSHLKGRWDGVQDLLLVNIAGLDANRNAALRRELRGKNIQLMVIKNSLARRATEGTALAPAFEGATGTLAAIWGASDIVALAKEVTRVAADKQYAKFEARGGVMDGAALGPKEVEQVSKWPSREEQLSILVGQVLSPGALLSSQLTSMGGALASQVKELIERQGGEAAGEASGGEAPGSETAAAPEATA
jgi:large subunit ribosomal protein L10